MEASRLSDNDPTKSILHVTSSRATWQDLDCPFQIQRMRFKINNSNICIFFIIAIDQRL